MKIEVGSNSGNDTEHLAADGSDVYAFEPSPELYLGLVHRFKDKPNVRVFPFAISDQDGISEFNICLEGDQGLGSLYSYHPNLLNSPLGKHDIFHKSFARQQKVLTMRLDTFMMTFLQRDSSIEYLWIDAQGNDFAVLKSLGLRIELVREGRCECTYKVPLYDGPDNSYEKIDGYLQKWGFKTSIEKTHEDESEIDLRFWR